MLVLTLLIVAAFAVYLTFRRRKEQEDYQGLQELHRYRPPVHAILDYSDAFGAATGRAVDIRWSYRAEGGEIYLRCFCHLRNAERSFRADRIQSITDDQGKTIDVRQFLADRLHIELWSRALRAKAPSRTH